MFRERLKAIRKSKGYTMRTAAEALDTPFSTYSKYESGERSPDLATLAKLAVFFQCSSDYLIGLADHPHGHFIPKEKLPAELAGSGVEAATKIGAPTLTEQEVEVLKRFAQQLQQQD